MENDKINRKEAREKAEVNSRHNDMKQHADKLIQGFQKLSDSHAKRAIWELFQNAIDLAEHAEIIIEQTNDAIIFKHNGKPFDDNTLNCLIKQVSSKSAESNDEEIGQYGTGFITTHSFGRKILLSGSLKNEGAFIALNKFELDRTPKTSPELIKELVKQQDAIFDLIEKGEYLNEQSEYTEFAYQTESPLQKNYANEAIISLPIILPYVMFLNKRLQKVTVIDIDKKTTVYLKGESRIKNGLNESEIKIDSETKTIFSIENVDPQITVVLPLKENNESFIFDSQLSKLFLYYPLIGTEMFGINFIIHSKQFYPTEQRDGIYLKSKTEQVQQNEEENRNLIQKASEMIFEFIELNAATISSPLNLAQINFNVISDKPLLNEYLSELKTKWIDKFKTFPLVETATGNIQPSEAAFLDNELLLSVDAFNAIYSLVSKYWHQVPKKELVKEWTKNIAEWDIKTVTSITIKDLVLKIQGDGNLDKFEDESSLQTFYKYLIENGHADYFNQNRLLPNIKGEFRLHTALNNKISLPDILIEIADVIMPDISKRHIHPNFKFDLELTPYIRKNFSTEINTQIATIIKDDLITKNVADDYLAKLIDYSKIITTADTASVPSKIVKLICQYYKHDVELIPIAPVSKDDEIDIRPTQKRLIRLFLNDVSKEDKSWVEENIKFLKEVLELGVPYYDYEDLFKTLPVFPNQLYELTSLAHLQVEDNIPDEIKNLYDKVIKSNYPIRANLVHIDFTEFLKNKDKKTTRSLTEKIESAFSSDGQYSNIIDHPFQEEIMFIIQRITIDEEWGHHFPLLNIKRANVMLDRVSDNQIKSDVFSIIKLKPDQINKLGNLSRNKNMDRIIELGTIAFGDEQQKHSDFQFKHAIGKHIENLIKEKIGNELGGYSISVQDVQNGQDIVISKENEPIYFIEVKSRWDERNSVTMSKNQFMNAINNKDKYSLCAVDMTKYKEGDPDRYKVEDTSVIFDRIKFINTIGVSLEPLISGILLKNDIHTEITLTGDYKATIPQTIIQLGKNLNEFVNDLLIELEIRT